MQSQSLRSCILIAAFVLPCHFCVFAQDAQTKLKRPVRQQFLIGGETFTLKGKPGFIIHGTDDTVVPIAPNSAALRQTYIECGAGDLVTLQQVDGQGHNFWPGFFRCQPLVDFVIEHAK